MSTAQAFVSCKGCLVGNPQYPVLLVELDVYFPRGWFFSHMIWCLLMGVKTALRISSCLPGTGDCREEAGCERCVQGLPPFQLIHLSNLNVPAHGSPRLPQGSLSVAPQACPVHLAGSTTRAPPEALSSHLPALCCSFLF